MSRQLLIDQGNTRVKLAWTAGEGVDFITSSHDIDAAVQAVAGTPDRVWLSSVADDSARSLLLERVQARWTCPCNTVSVPAYQHHLPTRYVAEQLGVDRWLAMLGCRAAGKLPCVVADCGTAITVDLVDGDGVHLGGYVMPGLELMRASLLDSTAINVPGGTELGMPPALNTVAAIGLGARVGAVALIERQLAELGSDCSLFLGGGDAAELAPLLRAPHDRVEQMVLLGLARLSRLEDN